MSPTSYQTAPPREIILTESHGSVKPAHRARRKAIRSLFGPNGNKLGNRLTAGANVETARRSRSLSHRSDTASIELSVVDFRPFN